VVDRGALGHRLERRRHHRDEQVEHQQHDNEAERVR